MKKILSLGLLVLSALTIVGCNNQGNDTEDKDDDPPVLPEENLFVGFYLDFNSYEPGNFYHSYTTTTGVKLTPPPTTPTAADATDPAFPTFLGWSTHSIIDSTDDLWDFETDIVPSRSRTYIYLYGIWVAE